MAGWGSRLGSWGSRFGSPFGSPFARASPTSEEAAGESPISSDPPTVTDKDFSYITAADLAKDEPKDKTPDVLVLKHRRVSYPIHLTAGSIDGGDLTIGKIREVAASKVNLPRAEAGRIKLYFRGKNLKNDSRTAKEEGMRSGALQNEILMVVGEHLEVPANTEDGEEEDVDEEEDGDDKTQTTPGAKKKRRNRKKNKRGNKSSSGQNSGTATPTTSSGPSFNPDATFVPHAPRATPVPPPASAPPKAPVQTPLEKLDTISSHFHTKLVPECVSFISGPPEDQGKREFEHKKLTETILAQVLLKLDAVETEGDSAARQRRKDLVKEVQGMLNQLDAVMK